MIVTSFEGSYDTADCTHVLGFGGFGSVPLAVFRFTDFFFVAFFLVAFFLVAFFAIVDPRHLSFGVGGTGFAAGAGFGAKPNFSMSPAGFGPGTGGRSIFLMSLISVSFQPRRPRGASAAEALEVPVERDLAARFESGERSRWHSESW